MTWCMHQAFGALSSVKILFSALNQIRRLLSALNQQGRALSPLNQAGRAFSTPTQSTVLSVSVLTLVGIALVKLHQFE